MHGSTDLLLLWPPRHRVERDTMREEQRDEYLVSYPYLPLPLPHPYPYPYP